MQGEYIDAPALEHHYLENDRSDEFNLPGELLLLPRLDNNVNPMQAKSADGGVSSVVSFDIGSEDGGSNAQSESKLKFFLYGWIYYVADAFATLLVNMKQFDFELQFRKSGILISRAFRTLAKRGKLVWGSTFVALFFAFNFGWILGPSTDEAPSVSAVFAMGAVLLIMSNLQFVFFLFHNNEVSRFLLCHLSLLSYARSSYESTHEDYIAPFFIGWSKIFHSLPSALSKLSFTQ